MAKQRNTDVSQEPDQRISRRKFIQGAVVASAAAGAATFPTKTEGGTLPTPTPNASDGARAGSEEEGAFKILTPEQGVLLAAVLNRIIPASEVMPGAGDVGIANFVDEILVDAPHLRRHIIGLLTELHAQSAFVRLSDAEQDAQLQRLEKNQKESFDVFLQAAYIGYYSEPQVLAAVGWVASAESSTQPEPFDETLLEAVRKRGPIYKEV
jgi:hypothetical protein